MSVHPPSAHAIRRQFSCLPPVPILRSTSPHPASPTVQVVLPRRGRQPSRRHSPRDHRTPQHGSASVCISELAPCPSAFGGGHLSRTDGAACGHPSPSPLTRHIPPRARLPYPSPLPPHPSPLSPSLLTRHLPCDDGPTLRGSTLLRPPACPKAATATALPCPLPHV